MSTVQLADALAACPAIAILRDDSPDRLLVLADAVVDGGLRAIEVALSSPAAVDAITAITTGSATCDQVVVGAGTVTSTALAEAAVAAGARFLLTPGLEPEVAAWARDRGVPFIMGALTPTEIDAAHASGATAVKVFPARVFGPSYLRDIHGPRPDIDLVPVGGIQPQDAVDYLEAGALAVGLGSSLLSGEPAMVRARTHQLVDSITRRPDRG